MNKSRYVRPLDDDVAQWADSLNEGDREWFEERSSIVEYDGGISSRRDAERAAMEEIQAHLQKRTETPLTASAVQKDRK